MKDYTACYYTAAQLAAMGVTLERDVNLWTRRIALWLGDQRTAAVRTQSEPDPKPERGLKRNHNKKSGSPPRTYVSEYKGVTVYRKSWYFATWLQSGARKRGRLRPLTSEGERWAAQERARALGLNYLEKRDGTRVPYPQYEAEEMAA